MATDDERREVSRRLRSVEIGKFAMLYGVELGPATGTFAQIVSTHPEELRRTVCNLADLIEPACDRGALKAQRGELASDDERREVAQRLRELDDGELEIYDMTYFAIERAVGGQGLSGRELADRLADLIEPGGSETKRKDWK